MHRPIKYFVGGERRLKTIELKPDGRLYSRILRRIESIVLSLPQGIEMAIGEIAEDVHKKNLPKFYLKRSDRPISIERIRAYVRYLRDIKILVLKGDKLILNFPNKKTDQE